MSLFRTQYLVCECPWPVILSSCLSVCVCARTCVWHVCMCVCMHACVHVYGMCACRCVCVCAHPRACVVHVCVCLCVLACVCVRVCSVLFLESLCANKLLVFYLDQKETMKKNMEEKSYSNLFSICWSLLLETKCIYWLFCTIVS